MSKESEETKPEDWRLYQQPITSAIPYFYRWKINQLKLMAQDLIVLRDKLGINWAGQLLNEVQAEGERLCRQLTESINRKRQQREKYETKKETVQV